MTAVERKTVYQAVLYDISKLLMLIEMLALESRAQILFGSVTKSNSIAVSLLS